MSPRLKCLWQYICDNADAAGVWEPDFGLASYLIGETVSESDLMAFDGRIEPLKSGKIRVISFLEFQYGKLSKDCKAHIPIFRLLEKHSLSIAYPKAIRSLQETEKEEEEEEDKEKKGSPEGDSSSNDSGLKCESKFPTESEVLSFAAAKIEPISPEFALAWFAEMEGAGWVDRQHRVVHPSRWRRVLDAAWRNSVNVGREIAARTKLRPGSAISDPDLHTKKSRFGF